MLPLITRAFPPPGCTHYGTRSHPEAGWGCTGNPLGTWSRIQEEYFGSRRRQTAADWPSRCPPHGDCRASVLLRATALKLAASIGQSRVISPSRRKRTAVR